MTYGKIVRWEDLPDSPGKKVLEEILNTPVPDFIQLDKDVAAYEKFRKEERLREQREKAEKEKVEV